MARAVDVRVMALVGLILDVRRGNRQNLGLVTTSLGFRGLGHLIVADILGKVLGRLNLGDRRRQGGFAMVDVTDGPDIDVRFCSFEFLLSHGIPPRLIIPVCFLLPFTYRLNIHQIVASAFRPSGDWSPRAGLNR